MNLLRNLRPGAYDGWPLMLIALVGATAIVRWDIAARRDVLQAEARTAHRLLSQATSRVDAVLATLTLVAPVGASPGPAMPAISRLPALYPSVLAAWQRLDDGRWPPDSGIGGGMDALNASPTPASFQGAAQVLAVDGIRAQYTLVSADPASRFALRVDARRLVPPEEWPWPLTAPVRATLSLGDQQIVLQEAASAEQRPTGLTDGFELSKTLATTSQPFVLHVQRFTGPSEWPWLLLAGWLALSTALYLALMGWFAARAAHQRAALQVRMAQASRLNTMGELAAGMAHELNQPLTAVLASTQAAARLLQQLSESRPWSGPPNPDDPEACEDTHAMAAQALELASAQARRAAEVVARLRRLVQPGATAASTQAVDLRGAASHVLALLHGELSQAGGSGVSGVSVAFSGPSVQAQADPVAVEQILHNLLSNAIQAMARIPAGAAAERRISLEFLSEAGRAKCVVRDTGPGVAAPAVPHLFEPFYTTTEGGLGLGLPLCLTLANAMQGQVRLRETSALGAAFELDLPAAQRIA